MCNLQKYQIGQIKVYLIRALVELSNYEERQVFARIGVVRPLNRWVWRSSCALRALFAMSSVVSHPTAPILVAAQLSKTYPAGDTPVHAVRDIDLTIARGDFIALVGPSGCGKSTLLHLCGGMDRPSAGTLTFEGHALASLSDDDLTALRRTRIGFVFQFFNLLPTLTVLENIALPLRLAGSAEASAHRQARACAADVGIESRLAHYPQQLSGGEMQRTAIARAVVHQPALLIADEPTGSLDSENGDRILALLTSLNADRGVAILLATHAPTVAAAAHRVVHLRDGRVARVDETPGPARTNRVAR